MNTLNHTHQVIAHVWGNPTSPVTEALDQFEGVSIYDEIKLTSNFTQLKKALPKARAYSSRYLLEVFYTVVERQYTKRDPIGMVSCTLGIPATSKALDRILDTVGATPEGFQIKLHPDLENFKAGNPASELAINPITKECFLKNRYLLSTLQSIDTLTRVANFIREHKLNLNRW